MQTHRNASLWTISPPSVEVEGKKCRDAQMWEYVPNIKYQHWNHGEKEKSSKIVDSIGGAKTLGLSSKIQFIKNPQADYTCRAC